jgi:EpsI family protein
MLVFGIGYRVLAARLASPVNTTPIDSAVLAEFPTQIGAWTGQDVPMDEAIIRATDTDARINRLYARHGGMESILLYVACGVKARDLMPHRPEVCYTGSGWTLMDRRSVVLPLSDGIELPCNLMQFARGALRAEKVMVLYYYIVDGQYSRDVSLLRSKAWRGSSTVGYVAQVQLVVPVTATLTADSAQRIVSDFASESASLIAGLFEGDVYEKGRREEGKKIRR